jgi:hypothetical protein
MNKVAGANSYRLRAAALREAAGAMATPELHQQALVFALAWERLAEKAENPPPRQKLADIMGAGPVGVDPA